MSGIRQIFFTSDTHFGHENIIKYCDRPYATVDEMDEALVENWNARVRSADLVYHLGDFAVTPKHARVIRPKLNGTIRLVVGNHDNPLKLAQAGLFQRMYLFRIFKDEGFVVSHMPMAKHLCRAPINAHGHIHNNASGMERAEPHQINVSVEMTNFAPVHMDELKAEIVSRGAV